MHVAAPCPRLAGAMLKSTGAIVLALLVCMTFTPASARQAPAAGAQPSIPHSNQAPEGGRPKMLVLHGNVSLYQGRSVAQVDADLRAAAEAQGYEPVVTPAGSSSREQEQWARARIAKGDIKAVMGFSMGGYTTERLKAAPGRGAESIRSYERLGAEFDRRTGAVRGDDPRFPGVGHMDLPAARARQARAQAAAHVGFSTPGWIATEAGGARQRERLRVSSLRHRRQQRDQHGQHDQDHDWRQRHAAADHDGERLLHLRADAGR